MKLLIADDEAAPREQLAEALAAVWPEARIVAQAEHGADAWDLWLEHQPEVCFLDIRMPGLTGIEVAQRIAGSGVPTAVVFVSAYGDHALAAFDAGAVDYVVKPVQMARLAQAVARVRQRPARVDAAQLQALLAQLQPLRPPQPQSLQASVGKEVRLIPLDAVLYFESDARYTRVVYRDAGLDGPQRDALLRTPLKDWLAQLDPQQFTQVHRSVIVATRQMLSAQRDDEGCMWLRLRDSPDRLPVSRPFQPLFKGQ